MKFFNQPLLPISQFFLLVVPILLFTSEHFICSGAKNDGICKIIFNGISTEVNNVANGELRKDNLYTTLLLEEYKTATQEIRQD
jgi:hypothetical protein